MADKSDRGTHNDPAWEAKNLTGGSDSGAAGIDRNSLDIPDGPDLTSRLLEETPAGELGLPDSSIDADRAAHEERDWPGTRSQPNMGGSEVTDESGRIAPAETGRHASQSGGARDPIVTGDDGENVTED